MIKAEYKGVKYEAKNDTVEVVEMNQASDYYISVFETEKNVAHLVKVDTPF